MNNIFQFLSEMTSEILTIVGIAYLPLIVMIIFRAGRLRGLTEENMAQKLGDLCFDTIKSNLNNKIHDLLTLHFGNHFHLPPGLTIQEVATQLHQDSESLEQLLLILKNLTEAGVQSAEFHQIIQFLSPFI